jgi:hypothetical protein
MNKRRKKKAEINTDEKQVVARVCAVDPCPWNPNGIALQLMASVAG